MHKYLNILAIVLCLLLPPSHSALATEVYGISAADLGLYSGNRHLFEWDIAGARRMLDSFAEADRSTPAYVTLRARLLFMEGDYPKALDLLERSGIKGSFSDLVKATVVAADGFQSRQSEHFIIYWKDERDALLAEPGLDALEKAWQVLNNDMGFVPDGKVRVEIYPSVSSFTSVSTLSREEVRTSGTIGLCKFNRIMITSPRATLWGFGWRDTLVHEYVHMVVYKLSRGRAPIWIHEGIAKYLEASWRGRYGILTPSDWALLARRLRRDDLITIEQMSPSVAKLPSAEDTQLAFAEVATMFAFLAEQKGLDAIRAIVNSLAGGLEDKEALMAVWGEGYASFQRAWRSWVENLPVQNPDIQTIALKLAGESEDGEDPSDISDREAGDFSRLGDLLQERGRDQAAAKEYARAYETAPHIAGVASRHLWGRIAVGDNESAVMTAMEAIRLYPDLPVLWYRKGMALAALGRHEEAVRALRELMEINPFHIPGRRLLLASLSELNDKKGIKTQEEALEFLEKQEPH